MHGYIITYRPSNSYNVYVHHIGNILYMVLLLLTWMMDGSPVSVCVKGENVWRESIWHIPIEVCVSSRSLRSYGLLTSEAIWHILSPFLLPLTHPSRNWSKVLCCVFTAFMTYDMIWLLYDTWGLSPTYCRRVVVIAMEIEYTVITTDWAWVGNCHLW